MNGRRFDRKCGNVHALAVDHHTAPLYQLRQSVTIMVVLGVILHGGIVFDEVYIGIILSPRDLYHLEIFFSDILYILII